jgi:hypothetical protein
MTLDFGRLRLEIREDRIEIAAAESKARAEDTSAQDDHKNRDGPAS